MMMSMLPYTILSTSLMPVLTYNPLIMSIMILLMTAMMMSWMMKVVSPWIIMIMFLIYVGGMMVVISYFLALQPNLSTNMFKEATIMMMVSTTLSLTNMYYTQPSKLTYISSSTYIFSMKSMGLLLLMLIMLFLALVITVSITKGTTMPMRPYYTKPNLDDNS